MQNQAEALVTGALTSDHFIGITKETKKGKLLSILSNLNGFFNKKATWSTKHLKFKNGITDDALKEIIGKYPNLLSINLSRCLKITDFPDFVTFPKVDWLEAQ